MADATFNDVLEEQKRTNGILEQDGAGRSMQTEALRERITELRETLGNIMRPIGRTLGKLGGLIGGLAGRAGRGAMNALDFLKKTFGKIIFGGLRGVLVTNFQILSTSGGQEGAHKPRRAT